MQPEVCNECGNAWPVSGGCCPHCMILVAEERLIKEAGVEPPLEYIDEHGAACLRLPPDVWQIRRTATWLLLLSVSIASLMLVRLLVNLDTELAEKNRFEPMSPRNPPTTPIPERLTWESGGRTSSRVIR